MKWKCIVNTYTGDISNAYELSFITNLVLQSQKARNKRQDSDTIANSLQIFNRICNVSNAISEENIENFKDYIQFLPWRKTKTCYLPTCVIINFISRNSLLTLKTSQSKTSIKFKFESQKQLLTQILTNCFFDLWWIF